MDPSDPGVELEFPNGNRAIRVNARPGEDPADLITRLRLDAGSRRVIVVCGGAGQFANGASRPATVLARAISHATAASDAVVLDGGTESGVMRLVGNARAADPRAMPVLIGVAPAGKVIEPGQPESDDRTPLEPNHSHFVLADGDEWGDETELLFSLAAELGAADDIVVVLAGGGDNALREANEARRRRWPLIAVQGFGGLADEIASSEIADYGQLGIVIEKAPEQVVDLLGWELDDRALLKHAWRLYATFNARAESLQDAFKWLERIIIGLGVVLTAVAVVNTAVAGAWEEGTHWATIVLPSVIALLVAWSSRRAVGKRWIQLRAAAEAVLSETFRYRTSTGPYSDPPRREAVLRQRLELITDQLSANEAATAPVATSQGPGPPENMVLDQIRDLTPTGYVHDRIDDQRDWYQARVRDKSWRRNVLQLVTLAMGGTGTILAAANHERWVAITAAVATAAATYLASRGHEQDVVIYNATATDLDSVRLKWLAGPKDAKAVEHLVTDAEEILTEEVSAWARRMARALDEQERKQQEAA